MKFGNKLKRAVSGLLAGCVLCSMAATGFPALAAGTEGVDEPYNPFVEAAYAYPRTGMKATVGTQHSASYGGARVLDGNPDTLWEGPWNNTDVTKGWITIDLGGAKTVGGVAQLPRKSTGQAGDLNGLITKYEIYVSTDNGVNFNKVSSGEWSERKGWRYAAFSPVEGATHVKFQATEIAPHATNPNNLSMAELRILPEVAKGDAQPLTEAVEAAALLAENDYTPASWSTFSDYLRFARGLLSQGAYVQEELDTVKNQLLEAQAALEPVGDMQELLDKLAEAKKMDNPDNHYYENTFNQLKKAIKDAEYMVESQVTKEEADAQVAALQAAIDGLLVRDADAPSAFDTAPAMASIGRLLGEQNADKLPQIELKGIEKGDCIYDYYEYYAKDGKLLIAGTTNASILTGFNHWLKYVAECNVSWREDQVNLPDSLPLPSEPNYQSANAEHRFAGNDMTEQYDGNYWSFEDWEREIDLLALNGFNQVLVYTGQESVFYQTFVELGVSEETMLSEMPRVSFALSLFLGGSWRFKADDALNSPNIMTSVTPDIMQSRLEIGQKACDRLREMGMDPILPGCSGYLAYAYPEVKPEIKGDVVSQGAWATMPRPDWLKPTSPYYAELAETYYRVQKELFGEVSNYKIDLFNEGGSLGGVDPGEAGAKVQEAMLKANPDATWHIMHWSGPNPDMLKGMDVSKVFIHDIKTSSSFDREVKWSGAEYGFSHLNSMGSRTTMGSRVKDLSEAYWERMNKPGSKMNGVGIAPEGGHHEPVILESMGELAWQDNPTDGSEWFQQYADRRYGLVNGQPDEHARAAWTILGDLVYDKKGNNPTGDILFAMSPDHSGNMASPTGPGSLGFDSGKMLEAFQELLQVDPSLRETKTYQYDLILVTTQVFTAYSREALPKIKAAFTAKDADQYEKLTSQWLNAILLLDEITGTNENFMIGPWIAAAKDISTTEEGKYLMEMDARQIITTWGPRVSGSKGMFLNYANKTWSGLLKDVYYRQWEMFFANNLAQLKGEEQPYQEVKTSTSGSVDFSKWYDALWIPFGKAAGEFDKEYPTVASGDTYALCGQVAGALGYAPCGAVEDLNAQAVEGDAQVKLSWSAPADSSLVFQYNVYVDGTLAGSTSELSYTVTGLRELTSYEFAVAAVNSMNVEGEKKTISATTAADRQAPAITGMEFVSPSEVKVIFNETLDPQEAGKAEHYVINKGAAVTQAALQEDGKTVLLTVDGAKAGNDGQIGRYALTVNGVADVSQSKNVCVNETASALLDSTVELIYNFDQLADKTVPNLLTGEKAGIQGPVTAVEGKNGTAAHFNSEEFIDAGRQEAVLQQQFTVGMWVKLDKYNGSASQTLLTHGASGNTQGIWWLYTNGSGKLNMQIWAGGTNQVTYTTPASVLNVNEWQYVTLTRDKQKLTFYVDGVEVGSANMKSNADLTAIGNTLKIGAENKPGTGAYGSMMGLCGAVDDLAIYNQALSAEEVEALSEQSVQVEPALALTQNGDTLNWKTELEEAAIASYTAEYYNEKLEPVSSVDSITGQSVSVDLAEGTYYAKVLAKNAAGETVCESNFVRFSVTVPVAKDTLARLLAQAKALVEETYTAGSYASLAAAMTRAEDAIADPNATQQQVNDAQTALQAAIDALVNRGTLKIVLDLANAHVTAGDVDKLIPTAKEQFHIALTNAQGVYENPDATEEQVDNAWKTLMNVIHALGFVPGDKTDLIKLVAEAKGIVLDGYEDGAEKDTFAAALQAAEDLIADPDAMKLDIDAAYQALADAMQNLIPKPVAGDKTELKKVIDEANVKNGQMDKYVDDAAAKKAFADALQAANGIYNKDGATQDEIDGAKLDLLTAMAGLRLRADKSSLNDWLDELKAIDLTQYTNESADIVRAVIAKAEALAAQDLSEDDMELIQAMVAEMENAKAQLEKAPAEPEEPENPDESSKPDENSKPDDSKPNEGGSSKDESSSGGKTTGQTSSSGKPAEETPKTGDGAPVEALSLLAVAAAGAMLAIKKRKLN